MSPNPIDLFNPLSDSGENPSVPDMKTPTQMAAEDGEHATVGWVRGLLSRHTTSCPAMRRLRRWAMVFVFLQGVTLTLSVFGLFAGRAMLREVVSEAVKTELKALGIPHASVAADTSGVLAQEVQP